MTRYSAEDHTFVICAYGQSRYLEQAVKSVKRQRVLGQAFISTSTPNDYIYDIAERNKLNVLVNDNGGTIARDWNYGFNKAETRLVTIAHQDDYYDSNYLEVIMSTLNRKQYRPGIVFPDYYEIRNGEKVYKTTMLTVKRIMNWAFSKDALNGSRFVQRRILAFGDSICDPAVTFDKSVVGQSVFNERFAQALDWKTWLDLADRGIRFLYIPQALMGHRIHSDSTTTSNIANSTKSKEELEILGQLWPKRISRMVYKLYSKSEKSNEL